MMKVFNFIVLLLVRGFGKLVRFANLSQAKYKGMKVGGGTLFVGFQYFGTEPYLIEIGENCLITDGVRFLNHDGSIQVPFIELGYDIKDVYSKKSVFGEIFIGDNVFVGVGAIILPGTRINSNSIVGAGSVVKGDFPAGSVICGNPSRVVGSVNAYYKKYLDSVLSFSGNESRDSLIVHWVRERG